MLRALCISLFFALILQAGIALAATLTVVNQGQEPIVELYAAGQNGQTWGKDLLGGALAPNQRRQVELDVPCPCRIKAIYADGEVRYAGTPDGSSVVFNH